MAGSGLPVPSDEEIDLLENAKVLDQLLYSTSATTQGRSTPAHPSGKTLQTWAGFLAAGYTVFQYLTDGGTLPLNKAFTLGSTDTFNLPGTALVGDAVYVQRRFGTTPVVGRLGTGLFRFPDGSTDTTVAIDVDYGVFIIWNGDQWEVKVG